MCAGVYSSHTHLYGSFALKYNGLLNSFIIIQMKSGPQQIIGIQIVLDIQCIPVGQSQWTVCVSFSSQYQIVNAFVLFIFIL